MRRSELPETGGEEGRGARLVLGAVVLSDRWALCARIVRECTILLPLDGKPISICPNTRASVRSPDREDRCVPEQHAQPHRLPRWHLDRRRQRWLRRRRRGWRAPDDGQRQTRHVRHQATLRLLPARRQTSLSSKHSRTYRERRARKASSRESLWGTHVARDHFVRLRVEQSHHDVGGPAFVRAAHVVPIVPPARTLERLPGAHVIFAPSPPGRSVTKSLVSSNVDMTCSAGRSEAHSALIQSGFSGMGNAAVENSPLPGLYTPARR